jgi:hypothetical protein
MWDQAKRVGQALPFAHPPPGVLREFDTQGARLIRIKTPPDAPERA